MLQLSDNFRYQLKQNKITKQTKKKQNSISKNEGQIYLDKAVKMIVLNNQVTGSIGCTQPTLYTHIHV